MHFRTRQIVPALVLLICLVCPVIEMFDHWDHTAQTGNDTEYTFVVLGLCVGVMYSFVRYVFDLSVLKGVAQHLRRALVQEDLPSSLRNAFFVVAIPLSPPFVKLRI